MEKSIVGNLLIAKPALDGTLFERTVCLLVHHDADNILGVVLNRPLQAHVKGASSKAAIILSKMDKQCLHFGGPNASPVLALHNCQALAEAQTGAGLYVASKTDTMEQLFSDRAHRCRLLVGHVQWSIQDLHSQLVEGCWATMPATADAVFSSDDTMWQTLAAKANTLELACVVGANCIPKHPALN